MKKTWKRILGIMLGLALCLSAAPVLPESIGTVQVQAASSVAQPKLVSAVASGKSKIIVKWIKVSGVKGYRVYRSTDKKKWTSVKTLTGANKVSYTDTGRVAGKRYYYTVRAYKAVNGKNVWSTYNKSGVNAIAGISTLALNQTVLNFVPGAAYTLKIKGTSLTPQWSSTNTSVATVNSKGKVTAKKAGSAVIKAVLGGRTFQCKVTVKVNVQSNKEKLKSYILNHGGRNSSGQRLITYKQTQSGTTFNWAIVYDSSKNRFVFGMTMTGSDGSEAVMSMNVPMGTPVNLLSNYIWMYRNAAFEATAAINPAVYDGVTPVSFRIVKTSNMPSSLSKDMRNLANTSLRAAFKGWNTALLKGKVGISLNDIGFAGYRGA